MPAVPVQAGLRRSALRRPALLLAQAVGGSLLLAVAAHVAVPFWPVPLTLQTLVVLGLGAALGPGPAVAAVAAWLLEGVAGLPVFAAGAGAAVLAGPTGGYAIGFLPAASVAGLAGRRRAGGMPAWRALALFTLADALLFAFGVSRLATLAGWSRAVAGGLTPFLLGEALKIGLVTAGTVLLRPGRATRA